MPLHDLQGLVALLVPLGDLVGHLRFLLRQLDEEAGAGERLQVVGLLEEHPLEDAGAVQARGRHVVGTLGEVAEDRVRFEQRLAVVELQNGNARERVLGQELRCLVGPVGEIERRAIVGRAEVGEQQPDLPGVAGELAVVEVEHVGCPGSGLGVEGVGDEIEAHGFLNLGIDGRIERAGADREVPLAGDDDGRAAADRQLGDGDGVAGHRIERAHHVGESGDPRPVQIGRHVFVVDAEDDLTPVALHHELAEVEAAAIGDRVLGHLAGHQNLAVERFGRGVDAGLAGWGGEHGGPQLKLEGDGVGRAVLAYVGGGQRAARRQHDAAVGGRGLAHHVGGLHDVAGRGDHEPAAVGVEPAHADLGDLDVGPGGKAHAAHLHGRMAAPVARRVGDLEAQRRADQPGIEAGDVPRNHGRGGPSDHVDQQARGLDRIRAAGSRPWRSPARRPRWR